MLAKSVDPTRLAATYRGYADRFVARGDTRLAATLFGAAMVAAADQNQNEVRREIAVRAVEALHTSGDMDAAREAVRVAEPVVESAGAKSAPELGRLWTYESDILQRLGRDADAAVAAKKAAEARAELEDPTKLELTLLGARLALDRGDIEETKALLTAAQALRESQGAGLASDPRARLFDGRALILRAELALREGDRVVARDEFRRAVAALSEAGEQAGSDVLRARVVALSGAGQTATSDADVAETIAALEKLRGSARQGQSPAPQRPWTHASELVSVAVAALAELEISAGRPSRALELVEQAAVDGTAAAPTAHEALCLAARASALSGREEGVARLGACASRAQGALKAEAELLVALLAPQTDPGSRRRALRQHAAAHGPTSTPRDRERAALASELEAGTVKPAPVREKKLRAAVTQAVAGGDEGAIVRAVESLAEHLIDTGMADDAATAVDENSGAFYQLGDAGPGILARLRTRALVASLQPIVALNYTARAISETEDLAAEDEAQILLAAAKNAALLGMWQHARSLLQDARARASSAGNRRLTARIRAFAKRFELPLTD